MSFACLPPFGTTPRHRDKLINKELNEGLVVCGPPEAQRVGVTADTRLAWK